MGLGFFFCFSYLISTDVLSTERVVRVHGMEDRQVARV